MSARDKIQHLKDKLCLDGLPPFIAPLLNDLAGAADANFDALLDDLDPLPQPDNFDLEPSNFGDIEEDGPNGGGFIGGGDDGDDGQDGQDGGLFDGLGGGPAGCIVPAQTPTGISGMVGTTPGTGIAVLTSFISNGANAEKAALDTAMEGVVNNDWRAAIAAEAAFTAASKPTLSDPGFLLAKGQQGLNANVVIAYNISSQAVPANKNILLGTDADGRYWVLVESCDES